MNSTWSQKVVERFDLQLPRDLKNWLDSEEWQKAGGAEFRHPLRPDQLVAPPKDTIWAGFMLPDTLPLIGNEYGDWLCLRVDQFGTIPEVLYWCHGGGDWIPYGNTLAEALIYDVAFHFVHPRRPEFTDPDPPPEVLYQRANWAYPQLSATQRENLPKFWEEEVDPRKLLQQLVTSDVAQVASRRDVILHHLDHILKSQCDAKMAVELGATWEPDFVSWLFDTALLPEIRENQLSKHFEQPIGELTKQEWQDAETNALQVADLREDLGWVFDIAGWAAERDGRIDQAIELYMRGIKASLFADDTVRFRTHWYPDGYGKFSAARLALLKDKVPSEIANDPYLNLFWENDPQTLRGRVCDYWLRAAREAESDHAYAEAYRCYYNAGWDVGLQSVAKYGPILEGLIRSAKRGGWTARAKVAQLHHQCFTAW
ncbi:MAG: hypothetical protein ACI9G1_003447 [Pirellulaceae bacterium]|jgi:hypothetical protein